MRILANYGCRNNGENFSVTFETMGDVPKEQADSVVDSLFNLAKAAVERQINPEGIPESAHPKTDNGNGNGGNGKLDKTPATKKQLWKLGDLLSGLNPDIQHSIFKSFLGKDVGTYSELNKEEASRVIEHLLANQLKLESMRV
ncbi:MAG: hypothetical protein ABII89_03050 [Candidatus Omnitrophota bacterium]